MGELRKDGLIEVRGSLFVHLARYSYLHVKNARIQVKTFLEGVPDSILQQVAPAFRPKEVDAFFRILVSAGLAIVEDEESGVLVTVVLTERRARGEVSRGLEVQAVVTHLKGVLAAWDPVALLSQSSSFPSIQSVAKATGVDPVQLSPGGSCVLIQDRPDGNEANPNLFLQETIDQAGVPLVLMQFFSLPDSRGGGSPENEFSLILPASLPLATLVREYCIPLYEPFFRSNDHFDLSTEVQTKYASYMHKYREKFPKALGTASTDRIDKILVTADPEGEIFANAVYVLSQVLRNRVAARSGSPVLVYQAARIAYAWTMALRVKKRQSDREANEKNQDTNLLVAKLRDSSRPMTFEDLKSLPDSTRKKDFGTKYQSILELLPLVQAKEGARPLVFEIRGAFIHRENLIRTFLDLREKESWAQRERLARLWAQEGIPAVEALYLSNRDVSADFLKVFELIHQERVLASSLPDFLKDFLPGERDLHALAHWIWPEGFKGVLTPLELVSRGLDGVLYEDKDRLRRRSLVAVLGLVAAYDQIVKDAWAVVFKEDGLFSYVLRRLSALFGGRPKPVIRDDGPVPAAKTGQSKGSKSEKAAAAPDPRAQKLGELKRLKELAPVLKDRDALVNDREKAASQWCFKLDAEASRKTRQAVDDEVARLVEQIKLDQLSEENSARVALFLIEKSLVLEQVTSSRAFHRYLYLTALLRRSEILSR